jgi:endoglucanase
MSQPRYGFNFQWMINWRPGLTPVPPDMKALDFLAAYSFDFVRIPTNYMFWTRDFDYIHPDERVFERIDGYLDACRTRGMHMSLNMHRAPGYCINGNDRERHNLWLDPAPQEGFIAIWENWARRYKGIPGQELSFDLVNEPPNVGEHGFTRENHAALIRRTVAAIRAIDPGRQIVIDGIGGGHFAMPELADLGVVHSGRGYQPFPVSHHAAPWWPDYAEAPEPVWPGLRWHDMVWDRDTLREFYAPWRDVERAGAHIHIGECGCFNKTPNDVAMRWMSDMFGLFKEFRWGFSLWQFEGAFGIADHGRKGAAYEKLHGYRVDRALLDLIMSAMARDDAPITA